MACDLKQQSIFRRIELQAQWEGRCNATDLIDSLGVSRNTASGNMKKYLDECPNNFQYDTTLKAYVPTEQFSPKYSSGQLDDYFSISRHSISTDLQADDSLVLRLSSSQRQPSPKIVRPIMQAISQKLRLDILYASLNNPQGEGRIISPHTLIHDGNRWHVRAWCEKNQDFRDFVLTRIQEVYDREGKAQYGAEKDKNWNTWLTLSIEPDARFTAAQQKVIAQEYGMELNANGKYQRHYSVRAAMLIYWQQQLRIDRYRDSAEAQQIILSPECRMKIKPWLPD
jgi:hypothetical protein